MNQINLGRFLKSKYNYDDKKLFYFTVTLLNRKHILKADKYKGVLIESFNVLVKKERVRIFAFVIMPNHLSSVILAE